MKMKCVFVYAVDTCQELDDIQYGSTNCIHGHGDSVMKIGDYCTFSCPSGFKLMGAKTVHCTKTGYDYTPPHCQGENMGYGLYYHTDS
mgnify:FL=1